MSNILVTGGCGFIGSNLVDQLIKLSNEVYVIDNLSTGLKSNKNVKARYYLKDIQDYIEFNASLKNLIRKHSIKIVYHLAALSDVREGIKDPKMTFIINQLSLVAISKICADNDVEKFVYTSTSAVYGEPKYLPVDELHITIPISPYGLSKLGGEQFLHYLNKNCDMEIIVLRLPNVYGPRQRSDLEGGVVSIFNNKIKKGEKVIFYGDGNQTRDWVHVYDIVDGLIKIIEVSNFDYIVISLGSGIENSLWNLFNILKKYYNYKLNPILEGERKGDIKRMIMSGIKAKNLLDWEAKINLEEGVKLM